MNNYTAQAKRSEQLLAYLDTNLPDDFFEWKEIIIFYTMKMYIIAYADSKKLELPHKHQPFNYHIDPKNIGSTPEPILPLPEEHFDVFYDMYRASIKCRYDGYMNIKKEDQIRKGSYMIHKDGLAAFKKFLIEKKIPDVS